MILGPHRQSLKYYFALMCYDALACQTQYAIKYKFRKSTLLWPLAQDGLIFIWASPIKKIIKENKLRQ